MSMHLRTVILDNGRDAAIKGPALLIAIDPQ
jgi:hypothetical protein